jgi:hypothetical protein
MLIWLPKQVLDVEKMKTLTVVRGEEHVVMLAHHQLSISLFAK